MRCGGFMRFEWTRSSAFLCVAALSAASAIPAIAENDGDDSATEVASESWSVWGGTIGLRWNRELVTAIGMRLQPPARALNELSFFGHERFEVSRATSIDFRVANNNLSSFVGGSLQARGGYVIELHDGVIDLTDFWLSTRAGDALILDVLSADGKRWFYVDRLMYELTDDGKTLAVRTMDLRISRELAQRIGRPEVDGWVIADMEVLTHVQRQGPGAIPSGGGSYYWAGTPATRPVGEPQPPPGAINEADLFMSAITPAFSRCNGCTGTSTSGQVVFTPSSTLKNNVNNGTAVATIPGDPLGTSTALWTADIPWYGKFDGDFPPYSNDQHPYLIWNLYRVNSDGSIDQIGRSGVKHAFLTTNVGCAPGHGQNPHVLGRQCSDLYTVGNNDTNNALGPRSEIIPATNVWGRCGSIYDLNCDGIENTSGNTSYSHRLMVSEAQIDSALQPGAMYWFESWYLAREDINIYNSMASITVTPSRSGTIWPIASANDFRLGPAIDRWVARNASGANERNIALSTAEGHTQIAVKARDIGNGLWRYDYVVMNHDFARARTECLDPVPAGTCRPGYVKVIHNFGFDQFKVTAGAGVAISDIQFSDGDLVAENNWTHSQRATELVWSAPVNPSPVPNTPAVLNPLNWGTMFRFSFTSNAAPADANISLHIAETGEPSALSALVIGPAASDVIFADGFE
jgi:hypothetical protein